MRNKHYRNNINNGLAHSQAAKCVDIIFPLFLDHIPSPSFCREVGSSHKTFQRNYEIHIHWGLVNLQGELLVFRQELG